MDQENKGSGTSKKLIYIVTGIVVILLIGWFAKGSIRSIMGVDVDRNLDGAAIVFTTSDKVQAVADFYKRELASNGWVIEQTANIGGSTVLSAKKDTRMLGVYIADAGDGQVSVTVSIAIPN